MRILVSLLFALFFAVPASADPAATAWRVVQSTGEVNVLSSGLTPIALNPNAPLPVEATVRTGATGQAILVRGGETILVRPNSELKLPRAATGDWTSLQQAAGSILLKVTKKPSAHFEVRTPYLAAVVKGTTFEVTVDKDGASVSVTEGLVEVTSPDGRQREMTPGGFTTRISRQDKQLKRSRNSDLPAPARPAHQPAPLLNAAPAPVVSPSVVALTQPIEAITDAGTASNGLVKDVTKRDDNSKSRTDGSGTNDKSDSSSGNASDGQSSDTSGGNATTDTAATPAPELSPSAGEPTSVATPETAPTDNNQAAGDNAAEMDTAAEKETNNVATDTPSDTGGSENSGSGSNSDQAATPEPTPVADSPAPVPAETDTPRNEHAADNGRNNAPDSPGNDNPGADHGAPEKDKDTKEKVVNEPALPEEGKSKKSKS